LKAALSDSVHGIFNFWSSRPGCRSTGDSSPCAHQTARTGSGWSADWSGEMAVGRHTRTGHVDSPVADNLSERHTRTFTQIHPNRFPSARRQMSAQR